VRLTQGCPSNDVGPISRRCANPCGNSLLRVELVALSLYLFKIALPPVLVAFMSLLARRFGPTIGGLLMGLPWMTGPVLFFLAWGRDADYAVRACTGVEIGTVAIAAFVLSYAATSRIGPWFVALPVAALSFAATAFATRGLEIELLQATLIAIATLIVSHFLIASPKAPTPAVRLPRWDIPARMLATFALVAGIMLSADYLGPQLSGVVASFPVILTVVGSFMHHQLGRDAVLRMHKGITLSLIGFALFFFVIGSLTPVFGLVTGFGVGALASLAFSGTLIILQGRQSA
jgi:hypothetical protein